MKIEETSIDGLAIITPRKFNDTRGFFFEQYHSLKYKKILGPKIQLVQDNISCSSKNVIRGLHFQRNNPQGKLVTVIRGSIFDVAVDLRANSKTFLKWFGLTLSEENSKQLWIPEGFAHGFIAKDDNTIVNYKCSRHYDAESEQTIIWNDEDLGIEWPIDELNIKVSKKDKLGISVKEYCSLYEI